MSSLNYFGSLVILLLASIATSAQSYTVNGSVYLDVNQNGRRDARETGIPNVAVSDQVATTVTDARGNYSLESREDRPFIMISMPNGYVGSFYQKRGKLVHFPLAKSKDADTFRFIHASDTHVDSLNLPRMARFRELADSTGASFILVSGDLIRDALRQNEETAKGYYKMYVSEIGKFSMPVFSGVGNHELFGIERDKSKVAEDHPLYGKRMYRHYLGPDYYSFNYGGIHFISVDAVDYQDMYYYGGVDSVQLSWLEADLKALSPDTPIITFNHIPFMSPGFSFQTYGDSPYYGPNLLKQEGELEHRHIVYNYNQVKQRVGSRPYPLALAGHYHAAQEGYFVGSDTKFAQTSAITRPDTTTFEGFIVRSGFTVYEVKNGNISWSKFIPLNLPDNH